MTNTHKLDYNLKSGAERIEYLKQIVDDTWDSYSLYAAANYVLNAPDEKKINKKTIITENRAVTLNKRETSFENICSKLENGENGIYNLISNLGKSAYLTSNIEITDEDYDNIPGLREMATAIRNTEEAISHAKPGNKYKLQKQLIEQRKARKTLKAEYINKMHLQPNNKTIRNIITFIFDENITITDDGDVVSDGKISFFDPKHISAILCNYSTLKQDSWENLKGDAWYLMADFDILSSNALESHPIYEAIVTYKIDGKTNMQIQDLLQIEFGLTYSAEYISSLWRNRIPKLIAEEAKKEYLIWYYTYKEYGKWKKCSKCGEVKLAHSYWFSKNNTSKDGWYSLCKECRNKKKGDDK